MANSVDPDQMPKNVAFDLGLHCLLRTVCPNTTDYYGTQLQGLIWSTLFLYPKKTSTEYTSTSLEHGSLEHGFGYYTV